MKILAVDTTAATATTALCEDKEKIADFNVITKSTHSEMMLPMIKEMLEKAKITVNDIDMIAVSDGPGSFTGMRIGIALALGMAFGKKIRCVGVSSLEALAYNLACLPLDFIACPLVDARRTNYYNAFFEIKDGKVKRLCDDRLISCEDLKKELFAIDKTVVLCGDGANVLFNQIEMKNVIKAPKVILNQSAYGVAQCALEAYMKSENKDNFTDINLKCSYLRPTQAQRELEEKNNINIKEK